MKDKHMKHFRHSAITAFSGIAASLFLLSACSPVSSAAPAQEDLVQYNQSYNQIVASYDMDGFLGLYADNPLWIAPTDTPVAGLDIPRNTFGFITEKKGVLTHSADHTFFSKDGSQAVLIGQYDIAIDAVGRKGSGTYLFVLQREGEDWKIVVDMFNEHKAAS